MTSKPTSKRLTSDGSLEVTTEYGVVRYPPAHPKAISEKQQVNIQALKLQ